MVHVLGGRLDGWGVSRPAIGRDGRDDPLAAAFQTSQAFQTTQAIQAFSVSSRLPETIRRDQPAA